jgi:peroxisomal 2,4-dienoyl-CoA reductase
MGTFNTIKATLPHVRSSKGSYIHISATIQYKGKPLHISGNCNRPFLTYVIGTPFQAHASAAKAAIDTLSSALAVEEGPRGVRSNVIAPGPISNTVGMEKLTATVPGYDQKLSRSIPLQRQGTTQDIANAAVFLFSNAATWITGQVLVVDGGARHTMVDLLPYPESVLDPEGAKALIQPRA